MKKKTVIACLLTGWLLAGGAFAQIKKGKARPLETKIWMRNVNGPFCTDLGKLLKEGPADDKAWAKATEDAQLLSEAGHVLMADGRCPDAVWADAAKQLREGSEAVLKALEAKDAADARNQFAKVTGACKACHSAHRK